MPSHRDQNNSKIKQVLFALLTKNIISINTRWTTNSRLVNQM